MGLLILAFAVFAVVTTEMVPVGLLPAIGQTFHQSSSTTGVLVSLYAAIVALLAVPLTMVTRSVDRKLLLLISIGSFTASNVAAAAAPSFAVLAAARALGGATHALFFSIAIGYATRLVPPGAMGRALAVASGGASAGFVLGIPLATALGNAVGWRGAFIALAALTLLVLAAIAARLPDVEVPSDEQRPAAKHRRRLVAAIVPNVLTYLGHFTLYTYISVMLLRSHASPLSFDRPCRADRRSDRNHGKRSGLPPSLAGDPGRRGVERGVRIHGVNLPGRCRRHASHLGRSGRRVRQRCQQHWDRRRRSAGWRRPA
jgi:predicted MFS family arabinose efflux permease